MTTKVTLPDGRVVVVPSDDPMEAAAAAKRFMDQSPAPAPTPAPARSPLDALVPDPEPAQPSAPSAPILDQLSRGMQLGGQNIGKVFAGVLGAPGDILSPIADAIGDTALGRNSGMFGEALGSLVPPTQTELTTGFVDMLSSLGLGQGIIPEAERTPAERIGGQAVQLGGEAAIGGAGLIKAAGTKGGRELAGFLLPPDVAAATAAGKAGPILAGDIAGGTGAGTAMGSFQELGGSEVVGKTLGPEAEAIANIVMAIGGGAAGNMSARAANLGAKKAFTTQERPRNVPVDQRTGQPFGVAVEDLAASVMQRESTSPRSAAAAIESNRSAALREGPITTQQTAGQLADQDFGLASLERSMRSSDAPEFAARDAAINDELAGVVSRLASEGDPRAFTESFETKAATRRGASAKRVEAAEGAEEAFAGERRARGDELAMEGSRGPEATKAIDEVVSETTLAERNRKNELFNAPEIEGETRDLDFLQEAGAAERAGVTKGARMDKETPIAFIARIKRLREIDPETGKVVGEGSMSVSDLQARRAELSTIQAQARKDGDFKLADSAGRLKTSIADDFETLAAAGGEAGEAAQKALDNFSERFGPTFARGQGDAATEFRKAFNQDTTTRTGTPPSKTAERFIAPASPERAASLKRVLALSEEGDKGRTAARQFLLADMVSAGVVDPKTGAVNGVRLGKWRQKWGDETLDTAAPGFVDEVAGLVGKAKADEAAAAAFKAETKAATAAAKLDEAAIMDGALGFALGRNPAKAVAKAFGDGDPQKAVAKIIAEIGDDEAARAGFKRAVTEFLVNKITNAPGKGTTAKPLSMAKLDKMFDQHAGALSEVFSPKEMNSLRQVSRILEEEAFVKSVQAISGSPTAGLREGRERLKIAFEAALKLHFGVLKGGGIMRAVNLGVKSISGDLEGSVRRLMIQAHLDPELAAHLLKRNIEKSAPVWNRRLQFLLQVGEGTRAASGDDTEE